MPRPAIHIINKFAHDTGGSEQRALRLGELLRPHADVTLWATSPPDPKLLQRSPITVIDPRRLRFPKFGTFILVGVYLHIGRWIKLTFPSRRIVVFNTENPDELWKTVNRFSPRKGIKACEIVYADEALQNLIGVPGVVHVSPIDLDRFRPVSRQSLPSTFTIGRLSRDYRYKFHEDDPALFRRFDDLGIQTRIMGGTCLAEELAGTKNIKLLPSGNEEAPDFLNGLDCFLYRTSSEWFESFGRVVFEAMACGIPVVCGPIGGYARYIQHGVNGFIFHDEEEAVRLITRLRDEPDLRREIGSNGRKFVQEMYSASSEKQVVDYYVGS